MSSFCTPIFRGLKFAILGVAFGFDAKSAEPPREALAPANTKAIVAALSSEEFKNPGSVYRPVDCWWWDGEKLSEEKLKWQIEDLHAKGVGGTWLYPRFGASQPLSAEPGFWTDGWWKFLAFALAEHERLGMQQWANDWLGRLSKNHFQDQLRAMREQHPELMGRRLVLHRSKVVTNGTLEVNVPPNQKILCVAAYRRLPGTVESYDHASRVDLLSKAEGQQIRWRPPEANWVIAAVASEPWGLDYLNPALAKKWIEIFFARYAERVGNHLGKSLTAYGPDERQVLNGDFLFSDQVQARLTHKGIDLLPNLPALFLDLGPMTDKIRCNYHACVVDVLEAAFYAPIHRWLHDHGMKQATIATWGRKNICGQTYNYGDFFRMMRSFDITGNEDSVESGASAFIDTKLSSSIAHLNGHRRVAVCAYWGTGWGFSQQENIARTNVNFALGVNLLNTHGGMYSFMGSRNEFVPPAVHFYQPYWQTWRTFYDSVARLSYALSQGEHRADVAILYPLSTLHAHWNGDGRESRAFAPAARRAEQAMFEIGEAIYKKGIDFDFVDEKSVAAAKVEQGALVMPQLRFSAVVLPAMTTIPLETARKLAEFVAAGGTVIAAGQLPMATPENGRDDPSLLAIWRELFGDALHQSAELLEGPIRPGHAFLVRGKTVPIIPELLGKSIALDVRTQAPDLIYTHNQVGEQHVYYIVNQRAEKRSVQVTLKTQGDPEIWEPESGLVRTHYRFATEGDGTRLLLDFNPHGGLLVVIQPRRAAPQVLADNLEQIDDVKLQEDEVVVVGTAGQGKDLFVKVDYLGRRFAGMLRANSAPVDQALRNVWECEYQPTMDNRWGDFRYPANDELIGPEMPVVKYQNEDPTGSESTDWASPTFDDKGWAEIKCGYGPHWQQLGPFDKALDGREIETQIVSATGGTPPTVLLQGKPKQWGTNAYSLKFGSERMDVHQQPADDGLGAPSDDFLVLDRLAGRDAVCYLRTRVHSPKSVSTRFHFGNPNDRQLIRHAWLNGEKIVSVNGKESETYAMVSLREGWNQIVLRIELPPRASKAVRTTKGLPPLPPAGNRVQTYAIFDPAPTPAPSPRFLPILRWYRAQPELFYDCGEDSVQTGWFRFTAPPGTKRAKLNLNAKSIEGWINGEKALIQGGVLNFNEASNTPTEASVVALRVVFNPGSYAGAAFTAPIQFAVGKGLIREGDWCSQGLEFYSGGLTYHTTVDVTLEQLKTRVTLDLGDVRTSAELLVNGRSVGVRLARPFSFDLSGHLHAGANRITVKTLNTLANYMSSLPTRYVYEGQKVSGILGPVTLRFAPRVTIVCKPE